VHVKVLSGPDGAAREDPGLSEGGFRIEP
jgi:hypothetical protein